MYNIKVVIMSRHEVKRVYRRTESIYSNVEFIGGDNKDGTKWKIPLERAIEGIKSNKWDFFIVINSHEVNFVVQNHNNHFLLCIDFPEIGSIDINYITINQYSE